MGRYSRGGARRRDWAAAESSFRRSIELNRNSSDAHHFYSHYFQTQGRAADAVRMMERAIQLDPLSLIMNTEYGFALYLARRYDDAIAQLRTTIAMDRKFELAAALLAQPLERKGMVREALAMLDSIPSGWSTVVLEKACALAVAGDHAGARRLIAEGQAMASRTFVDPVAIAMVYAELHDSDRAFEWLFKGREERSSLLSLLLTLEPKFDPLRSDPRYAQLVRSIGLKS